MNLIFVIIVILALLFGMVWMADSAADYKTAEALNQFGQAQKWDAVGRASDSIAGLLIVILIVVLVATAGLALYYRAKAMQGPRRVTNFYPRERLDAPRSEIIQTTPQTQPDAIDKLVQVMTIKIMSDMTRSNRDE